MNARPQPQDNDRTNFDLGIPEELRNTQDLAAANTDDGLDGMGETSDLISLEETAEMDKLANTEPDLHEALQSEEDPLASTIETDEDGITLRGIGKFLSNLRRLFKACFSNSAVEGQPPRKPQFETLMALRDAFVQTNYILENRRNENNKRIIEQSLDEDFGYAVGEIQYLKSDKKVHVEKSQELPSPSEGFTRVVIAQRNGVAEQSLGYLWAFNKEAGLTAAQKAQECDAVIKALKAGDEGAKDFVQGIKAAREAKLAALRVKYGFDEPTPQ